MIYVVLFLATSLIFLVADAIMLRSVIQPVFARHLGDTLYGGGFRLLPAILFYFTYMGGILYFASLPALRADAPGLALLNGAILGLVAYGTYEFTSWAVMRDWHPQMVAIDVAWGAVLTGGAAWGGVLAARALAG
ncbi:MAG: putative membrane protein [Rhodobacteraceae bacterium HLUCCO18]|nr:MAG: putative membrane protein [Rhodobacteraceae bacterium HLUCCO18]